jgi:uncharacterized protein
VGDRRLHLDQPVPVRPADRQRAAEPSDRVVPSSNYIRNSVKTVVDAYTGETTFYVVDEEDPIVQAWWSAFPDLFTDGDEMPDELREHLRYPKTCSASRPTLLEVPDRARALLLADGCLVGGTGPSVDRRDNPEPGGSRSTRPMSQTDFATESNVERFVPYYTLFRNGITGDEEFVLFRPFVPFSTDDRRTELQAYMTASSDPDTYGQLISYVVDQDTLPAGPLRVVDQAESEPAISRELSLQASEETQTQVTFGDLQLFPVADGLIYIRPVYVISGAVTEFRFVIVSNDNNAVMDTSLGAAFSRLFAGFDAPRSATASPIPTRAPTPTIRSTIQTSDEPDVPAGTTRPRSSPRPRPCTSRPRSCSAGRPRRVPGADGSGRRLIAELSDLLDASSRRP